MPDLDVSPMIAALRDSPPDFDMRSGRLRHIPSGHKVVFDPFGGSARIEAHCDCATLHVSRKQSRELQLAYLDWKERYWRTVQINREFASHFDRGRRWRALADRVFASLRHAMSALWQRGDRSRRLASARTTDQRSAYAVDGSPSVAPQVAGS
jgi:hypothetical protein